MANVYYTVHIPDANVTRGSPAAAIGSRMYFFNWITPKNASSKTNEMEVLCLDTERLQWLRFTMQKEEEPDAVVPPPRTRYALVTVGNRIYMWGGESEGANVNDMLWWSPSCDRSNVVGAWRRLHLVDERKPAPCYGHGLFSINDRYILLTGGIDANNRNSQDLWILDLELRRWKFVQGGPDRPYLWEGASYCAIDKHPIPHLFVFGCEMYRHHWNGASCIFFPGLTTEKHEGLFEAAPAPSDPVKGRWQRVVLLSSCTLQWKSPCFAMDGCVIAFDIFPVTHYGLHALFTAASSGALALWKLSALTNRWERICLNSSTPAPLYFDAIAVVDRKVFILGGVCRSSLDKSKRDLHIIDFAPTLQTLCVCAIVKHGLDPSHLPPPLKDRVQRQCPRTLD